MTTFSVTKIQFFDHSHEAQVDEFEYETVREYSANVLINDSFYIQVSGNDKEAHKATWPPADVCFATTEEEQEAASEKFDIDEIEEQIEAAGFENNFDYLAANADESL